jgi:hypothetical protein
MHLPSLDDLLSYPAPWLGIPPRPNETGKSSLTLPDQRPPRLPMRPQHLARPPTDELLVQLLIRPQRRLQILLRHPLTGFLRPQLLRRFRFRLGCPCKRVLEVGGDDGLAVFGGDTERVAEAVGLVNEAEGGSRDGVVGVCGVFESPSDRGDACAETILRELTDGREIREYWEEGMAEANQGRGE